MKRGHCFGSAALHTSVSITLLSREAAPGPSYPRRRSSCSEVFGMAEVPRDPRVPPQRGPRRATPREPNQLVQHANLLEAAHEAAAGCESADPSRNRDAPPPGPYLTPMYLTLLGLLRGKCLVSRMAGQGQRRSFCPLHSLTLRHRSAGARARSCSCRASLHGAPGCTGSSRQEKLPSPAPLTASAPTPRCPQALLPPGVGGRRPRRALHILDG